MNDYPPEFKEDMEILQARRIEIRPMIDERIEAKSFGYWIQLGIIGGFALLSVWAVAVATLAR